MGNCSSCEVDAEAAAATTAKLILHDGRLIEFSYPVRASYVVQKNPACFICNSDEMDFDDVVSAVRDDEELQPGQLYFELPLSRLRQCLDAGEMAALAVKASAALANSGDKCGCRGKDLVFAVDGGVRSTRIVSSANRSGRRKNGGSSSRRGKIESNLTVIPE